MFVWCFAVVLGGALGSTWDSLRASECDNREQNQCVGQYHELPPLETGADDRSVC
eukprot:COSAG05_NODE_19873_length_286_cov_1.379679_1_plen_54_part_01